jgi:hypothetical protein
MTIQQSRYFIQSGWRGRGSKRLWTYSTYRMSKADLFELYLPPLETGLYDSLRSTTEPSDKAELTVSGSTVSFSYRSPLSPS